MQADFLLRLGVRGKQMPLPERFLSVLKMAASRACTLGYSLVECKMVSMAAMLLPSCADAEAGHAGGLELLQQRRGGG